MKAYSVTDVAEYLTGKTGTYLSHARVYTVVRRLAEAGEIEDRRAGGRRILLDCDIEAIATQLGFATADLAVGGGCSCLTSTPRSPAKNSSPTY